VQLLVQSPLLVAFMVAMPLLVPLFYDGEFMPAVSMAQIALIGMFMRTMTYPVSFLTLAKSDTLLFVLLESIYNLLLVALVVAGYVTKGFVGVGAGIALAHTLDFLLVYGMLKFRYGLRLSGNVAKYFFMQLPLFVAMAIVVVGGFSGRSYWAMGAICTLLSLLLSIYFLKKQTILPDTFRRLYKKISRKFKK
jgi:O-antigen/teichoic acid export membrane protein